MILFIFGIDVELLISRYLVGCFLGMLNCDEFISDMIVMVVLGLMVCVYDEVGFVGLCNIMLIVKWFVVGLVLEIV